MVTYSLQLDHGGGDITAAYKSILDYLLTFVGEIQVSRQDDKHAIAEFVESHQFATFTIAEDTILLSSQNGDTIFVNLIRNLTKSIGIRIYNNQTKSFQLNDPNIFDIFDTEIDQKISKIFKTYNLIPLYRYRETYIFYAQDKNGAMHLVNRHLLEHLVSHPASRLYPKDFSLVVTPDIGRFVALFDRGLVPLSFYKCLNEPQKIVNLSGFNLNKLPLNTIVEQINFTFDKDKQSFSQTDSLQITPRGLQKLIKSSKFLSLKIGADISYINGAKKLIPILNVSVYLDIK